MTQGTVWVPAGTNLCKPHILDIIYSVESTNICLWNVRLLWTPFSIPVWTRTLTKSRPCFHHHYHLNLSKLKYRINLTILIINLHNTSYQAVWCWDRTCLYTFTLVTFIWNYSRIDKLIWKSQIKQREKIYRKILISDIEIIHFYKTCG